MRATSQKVTPEDYILAALSPEERLEAVFLVARAAFQDARLTLRDVEMAVRKVRRKRHAGRAMKTALRH